MTQLPLAPAQRHANRQLFADHYLDARLPQHPGWHDLVAEAAAALARVAPIVKAYTPSTNEAQVEAELVRPVLAILGHTYEVQPTLRTPKGPKRPDYIFYRDTPARDANKNQTLTDALLAGGALAVADAKYFDRPLDVSLKLSQSDADLNKVPSDQIAFYMLHSGLPWGVLTNGRRWRLYHRDTAQKQEIFYEIDLFELVASGDPAAFVYFSAFFGRAAFDDGELRLAAMLRASGDYARQISESIKAQVFDALRHVAQGLLDYPANRLGADPATLKQVYDASLIVLYRLLFILYAEARELLPLRASQSYRAGYSLAALTRDIAQQLTAGGVTLPSSSRSWARLRDLFTIIDGGSPPLQVSTFNGGLFDGARHPFLEQHTVGDAQLQRAIDQLARVDGAFVDYRDLAERHLGTIYEGLLEYHLEPIAPVSDASGAAWTIDLFNDRGERHRTGSYYTPDFVVQYIVAQTLRPVLDAAVAGARDDEARLAAVLGINVLDPAMGSGHFPVAAMEYIARYLVDLGVPAGASGDDRDPDLAHWKRRVAQSCIYGLDLNPLAVDLAKLSLWLATAAKDKPLSFLDHHLRCGNALIGARATALAGAAPLSRRRRPAASPDQLSMLDDPAFAGAMRTAVGSMWLIERSAGNTVAEVKQQEQIYADLHAQLTRRFAAAADLRVAREFGAPIDAALERELSQYVAGRAAGTIVAEIPPYERQLAQVVTLDAAQRFFHWDLEFPEVFFDERGEPLGARAGFDAVVGNPPYVRQEQLAPLKPYLQTAYAETYAGTADLYVYFYQQGLRLLREGGRLSYIVTNKWMKAGYGENLRGMFAEQSTIEQIVDFGHAPIFADADVFPCIIVVAKPDSQTRKSTDATTSVTIFPRQALGSATLDAYVAANSYAVPQRRFGRAAWSLEPADVDGLMAKIRSAGAPLTEFAGVKPYYGIKTGFNEAFLIDTPTKERLVREDRRSAEIIRPYLRGQDIKRWSPEWDGLWMIVLKSSENQRWPWSDLGDAAEQVFADQLPAIYRWMKPFEPKLRARQDQGRFWWELRSCAYYAAFDQPKMIHTDITWRPQFTIETRPFYLLNTAYIWPIVDLYVLAVLNSPLIWSYMWRTATHGKDEALRLIYDYVVTIPIAAPTAEGRGAAEPAVARLVTITQEDQAARRDTLDWLRTEFGVEQAGQQLESFAALEEDAFVAEVRRRRPRSVGGLSPAGLRALRDGYREQATPVQRRRDEALGLERRLAALVNAAYGLTPEDVDLLWRSAPPRMPVGR